MRLIVTATALVLASANACRGEAGRRVVLPRRLQRTAGSFLWRRRLWQQLL